jgi:NitT/TauT family transport system ATP-binding protein/sulfonate transport system ATP-binding protein
MAERHDPYISLRNPNFLWYVSSLVALTLGTQIQATVVGWQVYSLTKDPLSLGLVGLAEALPFITAALYAGHIADRHDRKLLSLIAVAIQLGCGISLLLLTVYARPLLARTILPIYAVVCVSGLARSFLQPARTALGAEIVPRETYTNAITWRSSLWQFAAVVGPSGCGKSTLLRLVAGLDHPSAGRISLSGAPVAGPGPDRGMVFQSYTLFPWLTVADNIAFGLREKGMPARRRDEVVREWLGRVGLTGFGQHLPKQLSGGMQQRTAIARALANDPAILLLDEPFGALDNQTRALMQELLLGIWERERKTVLFVTHDIEEAIFLASRVVVMTARPGRIKADMPIELPHPRHYTIKTSAEFSALKARLTEEIRAEAIVAAAAH